MYNIIALTDRFRKKLIKERKIAMKKILAMTVALCMSCFVFAGCGDGSSSEDPKSKAETASSGTAAEGEDTPDESAAQGEEQGGTEDDSPSAKLLAEYPVNDGAYDVSQGATENMLARAVLNKGDTSRLAEKIDHALNNPKETTKICFLGDSITAGSGANSSTNQYVNQVKTWWEENVSFYVDVTNAGIGATDSYAGVHRAQRDCVSLGADIIVIEFINDLDDDFYASCMDSLVRMCLAQENNPAVIILEPSCEGGSSPQNAHLKVAQGYNIPMISYHDAVIPEIDAGNFTWADISPDNVHPNDAGHIIMAQCITDMWGKIKDNIANEEKVSTPFDAATEAPAGNPFENASLGGRDTSDTVKTVDEGTFTEEASFQKFTGGWGTKEGGSATFEITAKNIGMLYMKVTSGEQGTLAVTVDDGDPVLIDGNFPNGWGNYAKADPIFTSDETATHTVKVEVVEGDAQAFQILNWLIS